MESLYFRLQWSIDNIIQTPFSLELSNLWETGLDKTASTNRQKWQVQISTQVPKRFNAVTDNDDNIIWSGQKWKHKVLTIIYVKTEPLRLLDSYTNNTDKGFLYLFDSYTNNTDKWFWLIRNLIGSHTDNADKSIDSYNNNADKVFWSIMILIDSYKNNANKVFWLIRTMNDDSYTDNADKGFCIDFLQFPFLSHRQWSNLAFRPAAVHFHFTTKN